MEIVFFLFGLLAIVPTCLLAMNDRQERTLHVHHWHHPASRQHPQDRPQTRYQVIADSNDAYVLDGFTGATYPIVRPSYKVGDDNEQ